MNSRKIDRRLADAEEKLDSVNTNTELEAEFYKWIKNNPLGDGPDFDNEEWLDSMPVQYEPFFLMNVLNLFPYLKHRA
jgi:hypothetical protein